MPRLCGNRPCKPHSKHRRCPDEVVWIALIQSGVLDCLDFLNFLYTLDGVRNMRYGGFMESSQTLASKPDPPERPRRGAGRGSNFSVLHRPVWSTLCRMETTSRMNLVTTFLVLLAGTGSDHRLTKWSAKACEEHTGLGKPRAKQAIEELIREGLVERTDASTVMMPQYRLPEVPRDAEPIFLPRQLITGLGAATPLLRRVRETGSFLALRMLIDLYGMVETDATQGIRIEKLRKGGWEDVTARKVCEAGVNAIWALPIPDMTWAGGEWVDAFLDKAKGARDKWKPLWEAENLLEQIGAIWFEPWIFQGAGPEAEPLLPIDPAVLYSYSEGDEVTRLTRLMQEAATAFIGDRDYLIDQYANDILVPLPLHHQPPAIRQVARMTVEADTPGNRRGYALRMRTIERGTAALEKLISVTIEGSFNRPISYGPAAGMEEANA